MICTKWNENWLFWNNQNSFALDSSAPVDAQVVQLPHDAMLSEIPYAESPNRGNTGYRDGGVYVYSKKLTVPTVGTRYLKLEGVYQNAMVYVNGALAATQPYGYTALYVPLHDYLNPGVENEIRVEARNKGMTNSRWYSGSGIYRDVYLLSAGEVYLFPDSLQAETRELGNRNALVEVRVLIHNRTNLRQRLQVTFTVTDKSGSVAAEAQLQIPVFPGEKEVLREQLALENPLLWDAEHPNLYTCRAVLADMDGDVLDETAEKFGIRTLSADAKHGLRINGKQVLLRGAGIHHDNGLLGAATYADAEYRRVKKLKEAGFNAIRMAHNPISPAMLRACDELGMYVMDEAFDMWTRCKSDCDYALSFMDWWQRDLEAMVVKDFNHPSVILYSLGNEIPEATTEQGVRQLRAMSEWVKRLDRTRFTTVAVNGVFTVTDKLGQIIGGIISGLSDEQKEALGLSNNVNVFMTVMDAYMDDIACSQPITDNLDLAAPAVDIMGYNYMTARYAMDSVHAPNRVIVGSETYPPQIGRNWAAIQENPNVIGDFTWTGWDYIGEAGVAVPAYKPGEGGFDAAFPCQLAYCGDLDITGFRRPASYFREIVFGLRQAPYITVQNPYHYGERLMKTNWIISDSLSSWTYPNMDCKPVIVEVYCAAPEVELILNGKSLGRKPTGAANNFTALFEPVYTPGKLEAVAWDGAQILGRMELATAGTEISIRVTEETGNPQAGDCLHFYAIELVDNHGVVNTSADWEISIQVENGQLLGFGSGNPKPRHTALESVTETYQGRAQAIVQSQGIPILHIQKIQ